MAGTRTGQLEIPSFKEALEKSMQPRQVDQSKIVSALEKLLKVQPYKTETGLWSEAVANLVHAYFSREIGATYQRLAPGLLDMQWDCPVIVAGRKYTISLPLFALSEIPKLEKWEQKNVAVQGGDGTRQSPSGVDVCACPPVLPVAAREAIGGATALLYEVFAKALRTVPLQDIILRTQDGSLPLEIAAPVSVGKFYVAWRPRPENLEITVLPEKDPAILLQYHKSLFVVHSWEIKEELPFKQILAEYAGYVPED